MILHDINYIICQVNRASLQDETIIVDESEIIKVKKEPEDVQKPLEAIQVKTEDTKHVFCCF